MSRALTNSLAPFTGVDPLSLLAYCKSIHYRFAHSEFGYLQSLQKTIASEIGEDLTLDRLSQYRIPSGGLSTPTILESLLNAVNLKGPFEFVHEVGRKHPAHAWLLSYPSSSFPASYKGLQSATRDAFVLNDKIHNMQNALSQKVTTSFGGCVVPLEVSGTWYGPLEKLLLCCPLFYRVCWLKTIAGAWCTSHRLHEERLLPCILGCDERDEIKHYLVCPVLWQLCREFVNFVEESISVESRLCIVQPSIDKLRALSFCHSLYHACRNDSVCVENAGNLETCSIVQQRAGEIARFVKHFVAIDPILMD